MTEQEEKKTSVRSRYGGGPHGLGDPDDKFLRIVEKDVLISKKVREKARKEKCVKEVEQFTDCCKANQLLLTFRCKNESNILKDCLGRWFFDEDFRAQCTEEYLQERTEYRRTGISKKQKEANQRLESST